MVKGHGHRVRDIRAMPMAMRFSAVHDGTSDNGHRMLQTPGARGSTLQYSKEFEVF